MSGRRARDYGPFQLGERLGLPQWALDRAVADGVIAGPDVAGRRWSAALVDDALARLDAIREAVGTLPNMGAVRAADVLADRFGVTVPGGVLAELDRMGLIPEVGTYRDHPVYDGRALERFHDRAALDRAIRTGRLLTGDEAADYLGVRRVDLDHLVRAGWLDARTYVHSGWQRRRAAPAVALYRVGDLDVIATHPAIDWETVRATPKGRPSPLARLNR